MRSNVGHYRIEGLIGRGGMGVVYRGVHDHLGRAVAIKALAPELTRQPEFKERFFAEAKTQAHLHHPNIIAVYDLVEDAGEYFIVMELVPGEGLDQRLKAAAGHGMALGEAMGIFGQILAALDYAHSEGVIHRDVKPSNALITAQGRVKLMDFGIALLIGDKRLTASQSSIGTPIYMSPEQILYPRTVDHRSDIYSAAVVLFEMLAGQPPFDADTEYAIKKQHIESPPPDLATLNPDLPPGVLRAIEVALSKAPDDRFPSAGAFLRALQEAAPATQPPPSQPTTPAAPQAMLTPHPTVLDAQSHPGAALASGQNPVSRSGLGALLQGRGVWILAAAAVLVAAGTALVLALALHGQPAASAPPPAAVALVAPPGTAPAPLQPAMPLQRAPASQPAQALLAAAQPPTSSPDAAAPTDVESPPTAPKPKLAQAKKTRTLPPDAVKSPPPEPAAPAPADAETAKVARAAEPAPPASASDLRVSDLTRMKEVIFALAPLADDAYDAAEHDPQKSNAGLRLLGDFKSLTDELKSAYQKATGTGFKGLAQRLRPHASLEADQMELKVQAKDLVRKFREIDEVMRRDPMGPTTAEYWGEIKKHVTTLDGFFH